MKGWRFGFYALDLVIVLCIGSLLLQVLQQSGSGGKAEAGEMHFVLIVPSQDSEEGNVREAAERLADRYKLDIEFHAFSTAAEQKQMLRVLPKTNVDGVLLWPISVSDEDYREELTALRNADIPIVVMERDVAQGLRNSFVGSGTSSDLVVLNQRLKLLQDDAPIVVGNLSGSGSSQIVELLFFKKVPLREVEDELLIDKKLRQMAETPPNGYQAVDYIRMEGKSAQSLNLKYALINLFSEEDAPELFFSLDNTLSATVISAKKSSILTNKQNKQLLCYGAVSQYQESLDSGVLNGLVTSRPDVSAHIGIRYLRDICRGFWVPETMDSGIDFLPSDAA
ncbi:MAG: hypothetical protein MSO56_10775 [Clostridiales bacterium]|nr:hypothetical protein [Clostridiales bacterium]